MTKTAKTARILPDLAAQQAKRIAELEALLVAATAPKPLSLKMGEKGTISVYGLGRFPTSLYRDQWARLIEFMPKVEAFIAANAKQLEAAQVAYNARKANGSETREVAA